MVGEKLHAVRGDVVFEAVPQAHGGVQVKLVKLFLAGPEEVVEDAQALIGVQGFAPLSRRSRFFERSAFYPVEKCPGLLRVLTGHGDGDVLGPG